MVEEKFYKNLTKVKIFPKTNFLIFYKLNSNLKDFQSRNLSTKTIHIPTFLMTRD